MRNFTSDDFKMITRRQALTGVLGACAVGGPSKSGLAWHEPDHFYVNMAFLANLTGVAAPFGRAAVNGAQLAILHANETYRERLDRFSFSLQLVDISFDPARAASETQREIALAKPAVLVDAGVSLPASIAIADVAERSAVPLLTALSSRPRPERSEWSFRLAPSREQVVVRTAEHIRDIERSRGLRLRSIVLSRYGSNDDATRPLYETAFRGLDKEIVNGPDLSSGGSDPAGFSGDAWIIPSWPFNDLPRLFSTLRAISRPRVILVNGVIGDVTPLADLPDPRKVLVVSRFVPDIAERRQFSRAIMQRYRERFNEDMSLHSAAGFTSVDTVARAVADSQWVGRRGHANLRDALRGVSIPGESVVMPWNGIRFDERGDNAGANVVFAQIFDRRLATVWPRELATREISIAVSP